MDHIEYLRESARTASGTYHSGHVPPGELDFMFQAVIAAGQWADRVKRALFYGKEPERASKYTVGTSVTHRPELADLVHAVIGCVTESAELVEHLLQVMRGAKPLDVINVGEEFGDLEWYIALGLRYIGSNHAKVWHDNIDKLRARFPAKFTEAAALNRDLGAERAVLEANAEIPPASPNTGLPSIEPGTNWVHRNGTVYEVVLLANLPNEDRYPLTVVYRGPNGALWARRADDWHRSMTSVSEVKEVTLRLPATLHAALASRAAAEGVSVQEWMEHRAADLASVAPIAPEPQAAYALPEPDPQP